MAKRNRYYAYVVLYKEIEITEKEFSRSESEKLEQRLVRELGAEWAHVVDLMEVA